ncbi:hypothetical protein PCE1_004137 [Barthelona sp. PCE]
MTDHVEYDYDYDYEDSYNGSYSEHQSLKNFQKQTASSSRRRDINRESERVKESWNGNNHTPLRETAKNAQSFVPSGNTELFSDYAYEIVPPPQTERTRQSSLQTTTIATPFIPHTSRSSNVFSSYSYENDGTYEKKVTVESGKMHPDDVFRSGTSRVGLIPMELQRSLVKIIKAIDYDFPGVFMGGQLIEGYVFRLDFDVSTIPQPYTDIRQYLKHFRYLLGCRTWF